MLIIAIIVALIVFVCGVITFIMTGSFALNWLNNISTMPDFLNTGNFFGWAVILIAFLLSAYIIRLIYLLFTNIISTIVHKFGLIVDETMNEDTNNQKIVAFVIVQAIVYSLTILGLMVGVHYIFELAKLYPDYSTMYNTDPEQSSDSLTMFIHFMFLAGVIFKAAKIKE